MEPYLTRADRVIAHAESTIAFQEKQLSKLSAGGNPAALDEARAALALMLDRLQILRSNRRRVEEQITRTPR